ncbi:hypothetical protein NOK12_00620 [Nocardioides sp. OK12]|uniref:Uncharacterized protein n=1 Tax=Nocardioides marinisabuli TaxID=419476 RepID=A0A7Y9F1Y7_9ACTN|nr:MULTISPECIES: hypothetical protein [Nocardioides]NYD57871.1 hypothetical protein [Nocardioides marinisabuli]GHJ57543.1 hypothetical protein NOK12_00620 [Nocardioides sp. OK12]
MSQGQHEREQERKRDKQRDADEGAAAEGGQVSEVQSMDDAAQPISDDQAVAGQPDAESGRVDEGPTGPNARSGADKN